MYVVDLCAPNTVNTMPEATLDAVAEHGKIQGDQITGHYDDARKVIDALNELGVSYDEVIEVLEVEGVQKFEDSYAQLAESVKANSKRQRRARVRPDRGRGRGRRAGRAGSRRHRSRVTAHRRRGTPVPRCRLAPATATRCATRAIGGCRASRHRARSSCSA